MINFDFGKLGPDECGKTTRKYLFVIGAVALIVLLGTYLYEYEYLPRMQQQMADQNADVVNQPQTATMGTVANQFAGTANFGMNVAAPSGPPIRANAGIPGNHKRDGRDQVACNSCHQIIGAQGNPVVFNQSMPLNNMAVQFAAVPTMAMNVAAPTGPPIRANATPPGTHRRDGRDKMVCSSCHQVTGVQGMGVGFLPVNEDPQRILPQALLQGQLIADPLFGDTPQRFADTVSGLRPSVVNINSVRALDGQQNSALAPPADGKPHFATPFTGNSVESIGSGVVLSTDGYIVTNYHVIRDSTGIFATVFTNVGPKRYPAEIVKVDETLDLAILKIQPDELLQPAPLGNSDEVRVADSVLAIGSPFGLDQTVSRGIVSGMRKSVVIDSITHAHLIQTDAAINQGNSGGALVSREGKIIGINTAIYTPSGAFAGIGFAIPINQVKTFAKDKIPTIGGATPVAMQGNTAWGTNVANPVGFNRGRANINQGSIPPAGMPFAVPVARAETPQAPRILAGTRAPHRDGREKMDCRICHQVINPNNAAPATTPGTANMTPVASMNQFAMAPQVLPVAAAAAQTYFEGAVLEAITPVVEARINVQVTDGTFISTVYPDTSADRAGLKAGDIVFKVNGRWVMSPDELIQRVSEYKTGDNLRLGVYTGGQRRNLYIVLSGQTQSPTLNKVGAAPTFASPQATLANEMTWLGMELKPITLELAAKKQELQGLTGTLVSDVDRNSLADWAGIQKGDVVKQINGLPVDTMDELDNVVNKSNAGQGVLFLLNRNGRDIFLTVQS